MTWWFITCLHSCFILLCFLLVWGPSLCVVPQCLSELDYVRFCFPQWLLWYSWFKHSSRTLLLCFWLTPQGLRFVCWLQMYTVAKHTVSVTTYIFLISVGDWLYFSGHGWRPLQISFESDFLQILYAAFEALWENNLLALPNNGAQIYWIRHTLAKATLSAPLLDTLSVGSTAAPASNAMERSASLSDSLKTQVQVNSIHIWESAFQSST